MPSNPIAKYLNPWKLKRERAAERLKSLRARDGDNCMRCRRPLRFDLPEGHDQAPKVEPIGGEAGNCLTHTRCSPGMIDHTGEVVERMRRKSEAALFSKARSKKSKAA